MPALIAFLINALRVMLFVHAGKMIVGVLTFFGMTLAVNKYAIAPITAQIQSMMSTGPGGQFGSVALQYLGILRMDDAVSMILSAYTVVYAIKSAKIGFAKVGV